MNDTIKIVITTGGGKIDKSALPLDALEKLKKNLIFDNPLYHRDIRMRGVSPVISPHRYLA